MSAIRSWLVLTSVALLNAASAPAAVEMGWICLDVHYDSFYGNLRDGCSRRNPADDELLSDYSYLGK
jgi:hypothetical protein